MIFTYDRIRDGQRIDSIDITATTITEADETVKKLDIESKDVFKLTFVRA